MNSKVFERAMFKAENKPRKADAGIMQGFDEEEPDDVEENDDEMMEEVSRRSPKSPEILMNNLRGDMRSVDARYQELAEMVGEEAAMETPPEVLAMLQPQLMAQQAPTGIGALPTQGVTPPQMPPAAAPMPTPPQMPMDQGGGMPPPQGFFMGGLANKVQGLADDKFDPKYYLSRYRDVATNATYGGNPAGHYAEYGRGEKRFANAAQEAAFNEARRNEIGAEAFRKEVMAKPYSYGSINPAYAQEFARSFVVRAPNASQQNQGGLNVSRAAIESVGRAMAATQNPNQGQIPEQVQPQPRPTLVQTPMYTSQGPRFMASGGIASLPQSGANYNLGMSYNGPVESGANYVQGAGRNGDTIAAHMSPEQHQVLTMMGGGSTTNPKTGLPEHYMGAGAVTNLMQRIQPYAQAANQYIGSRMAPVLTPPTMQQGRSTMGTFLPRTVEGMELTYPSLTQRIGAATEPVRNYVANMPASQKAIGALSTIPGGAAVMNAMGGGERVPTMPLQADGSDVPMVIGTGAGGERTYIQPPLPPKAAEPAAAVPTKLEEETTAPTAPKTVEELVEKQAKGDKKNRLEAYMEENLPIFEKYMGSDKDASQVQALLLLADAGLEYATKPARTGMMALANAFKRVPAGLSQIAAQEEARKSQIKGAALTSGLQTIAAEDKTTALLQRELIKKAISSGEVVPTDRGAGLTSYVDKQGQDKGMKLDPQVANSFLNSRFTPQVQKDKEGNVVGFNTPYARVSEGSQTINLDKSTRERLAGDISRQEIAIAKLDAAIKMYTDTAFGPKAFFANFKNNVLVPVSPLKPNTLTEEQRTKINTAMNTAVKAIARAGDTGNIAVAEQNAAQSILGDKPGTFFSDYETALKRLMTVRTDLANQRLSTASQLGWINQDVQLDVPNLGTPADPIPQDKLGYLTSLKAVNPNAQVYININGKATPVLLSTLKD